MRPEGRGGNLAGRQSTARAESISNSYGYGSSGIPTHPIPHIGSIPDDLLFEVRVSSLYEPGITPAIMGTPDTV